ncbi:hypothetical protein BYT27DRAFT_7249276 [Phlegmacium glaucopus]|nr:hypothetical protein BYT27DRAFT_7249276 [Phlegmacium glaucopus]
MFDRPLTRSYKSWPVSSPEKLGPFLSHFSFKEYERDIFKHDLGVKRFLAALQLMTGMSSGPNSSTSSPFAQNNGSNPYISSIHVFITSKLEKLISLSNPTSTSISNKSKGKKPYRHNFILFSPTPSALATLYGPSVSMIDSIAVALSVDGEYEAQQLKDQLREFKAKFLGLKDAFEGLLGGWRVWKESRIWIGLRLKVGIWGGVQMEIKIRSTNSTFLMGVSELGVMPGYVDAATVDVSSTLPATDELLNENNIGNITPSTTPRESQNDETVYQFMNTTSLSTIVDGLV